jgi:hypothetical protein
MTVAEALEQLKAILGKGLPPNRCPAVEDVLTKLCEEHRSGEVCILLEYKDSHMSGASGHIAVWLFHDPEEAKSKMGELAKSGFPLALYKAEPLVYYH